MERELGRRLEFNEVVHHKNEDPTDNRIENLELKARSEHSRMHATEEQIDRVRNIGIAARKPLVHGTSNAYFTKGCRCDLCKKVGAEQKAAWRARNKRH